VFFYAGDDSDVVGLGMVGQQDQVEGFLQVSVKIGLCSLFLCLLYYMGFVRIILVYFVLLDLDLFYCGFRSLGYDFYSLV